MKYWIIYGCGIMILFIMAVKDTRAVFSTEAVIANNQVASGTWDKKEDNCEEKDKDNDDLHLSSGKNGDKVYWKLDGCHLKKYKHYKYKITYYAKNDDTDLEKGFQGEGVLNENAQVEVNDLFLGSCSSDDKCHPDKYHGNMEVEVELNGGEDKVITGTQRLTDD